MAVVSGGERITFMDCADFIKARLDEKAARARGAGRIAWLTYRDADGQMLYTTVASGAGDDAWIADGKELPEPASVSVVFDEAQEFREVAAMRAILALSAEADELALFAEQHNGDGQAAPGESCGEKIRAALAAIYDPAWAPETAKADVSTNG